MTFDLLTLNAVSLSGVTLANSANFSHSGPDVRDRRPTDVRRTSYGLLLPKAGQGRSQGVGQGAPCPCEI